MSRTRTAGLGRGLDALIPTATPDRDGLRTIPLDEIRPNRQQPRDTFDQQQLAELAQSLQTVGLLQPIVVRPRGSDRYEIIAGERRFRAAQLAGLDAIPAVVRHTDDDSMLTEALVENIHRVDLNALEEAAAYQQLLDDFGLTHEQLAARLGRSRSSITNTLRLLGLVPELQAKLAMGVLTAGHARALLALDDAEVQRMAGDRVVGEGLSVRATERLVRSLLVDEPVRATSASSGGSVFPDVQRRLSDALATSVQITGSDRRGRVVIDFAGTHDLQRLLDLLERGVGGGLGELDEPGPDSSSRARRHRSSGGG